MFDAEKLLGTLMREVVGSGSGHGKKKKKKTHGNALINNLKSGTGLMTAIGLGIGAYEILRSKTQPQTSGYGQAPPMPPPMPTAGQHAPVSQPSPGPPPLPSTAATPPAAIAGQDLAQRMIQVMIAAAHADGTVDEQEEQAVLDRLKGENLSQEERMYLLTELHNPKPIEQLTAGITDPTTARAMYMLAVSAVDIDTEAERRWFDQLAQRLTLSKAIQAFIEEQA
jgi:uncharacterized membrane protein YebE (DUF533 family)